MEHISKLLKEYDLSNVETTDEIGNTILHILLADKKFAVKETIEILDILLKEGVDPNINNKNNETVLHLAVRKREKDVTDFLLKHQTNIDWIAHLVIEDEYIKFDKLLKQQDELDELDKEIQRIETESKDFIEWLISRGVDFDSKNKVNRSGLCMAIEYNLQHILPTLLKYTKDINFVDKEGRTLLHLFLEYCERSINEYCYPKQYATEIVKIFLDNGISVDAKDKYKRTSIRVAIDEAPNIDIVKALLKDSTNIDDKDPSGETLFHSVIKYWSRADEADGDFMEIARTLIIAGAHVNEPDRYGNTPAYHAIEYCNLQMVKFLQENGADFNVTIQSGITLMMYLLSCNCDSLETKVTLFFLFLEQSTNLKQKDCYGETVFHKVIKYGASASEAETHYYIKMARALIDKGADINEPDKYGERPLFVAIKRSSLPVVKFLLENGADSHVTTDYGETPMHLLVRTSRSDRATSDKDDTDVTLFRLLADQSTNINQTYSVGETIFYAVIRKWASRCTMAVETDYYMKIARVLVARGADVNKPDSYGKSPLCFAVEHNNLQIVEFLQENRADFNVTSENGETLIHILVKSKSAYNVRGEINTKLFDLLLEQPRNIEQKNLEGETVFYSVIKEWAISLDVANDYYMKIAHALIAKGTDINEQDKYGKRPLFYAIEKYNMGIVKFLRENGADFSVTTEDGGTLMHVLVKNNEDHLIRDADAKKIKLLNDLISYGFQVEAKDKKGLTPLHLAVNHCSLAMVQKLIEHGVDVNSRNNEMQTPLIYLAANNQKQDIAKLLLEKGANVDAKDLKGFTALRAISVNTTKVHAADAKGQMIKLLFTYGANFDARIGAKHSILCTVLWQNYDARKRKNHQVGNDGLPNHETCLQISLKNIKGAGILLKHWIKLNLANLIDNEYSRILTNKKYKQYIEKCLQEIEMLKKKVIDNSTTLYSLLHMDPNSRRFYADNEKLQQLVNSPKLEKEFPKYAVLVSASYHEAAARRVLLEPAIEAWLELTEIDLPDICIERIFSFLSNADLYDMIGEK